jgi:tight adherence protein B
VDIFYYLFVVLAFLAVMGLMEGAFQVWNAHASPKARRVESRLQGMAAGPESIESPLLKNRLLSGVPSMERLLLAMPRVHVLDRLLIQAESTLTVGRFLAICGGLALIAGALALVLGAPLWLLAPVMGAGALAPYLYYRQLGNRRLQKIEQQLPDALDLMAHAMQAGHAFSSALRMVALEGPEPIAQELRKTFEEINFGVSVPDALVNLAARVDSTDLRYFVIAVVIQRETGGNLAGLLSGIAILIRDRFKLAGAVRVLSSEGRLSAWILGLLPFVLGAAVNFLNPKFMSVLWTDPAGIRIVAAALCLMLFGVFWMWRVVAIRI